MTTYTAIPNGDIDQDSPLTQPLLTALRDNPVAITEGAAGAPHAFSAWRPFDSLAVGDGNTGLIYSYAVSGAVATVTTPDWDDGFEYQAIFEGFLPLTNETLQVKFWLATTGAYSSAINLIIGTASVSGFLNFYRPRIAIQHHVFEYALGAGGGSNFAAPLLAASPAQKILKAQFHFSASNISGGSLYLYRRRVSA